VRILVLSSCIVVSACGGIAIVDGEAGAGAGGGSGGTSNNGGSSGSSVGVGGGDGGCASNADCATTSFCDFPGDVCGGEGTCLPRPQGCTADCPGVCGCDGNDYCNACGAQALGVDVAGQGSCESYGAAYVAGEVDELLLWRRSLAPPSCSVIRFWTGPPTPGIDVLIPPPWAASGAAASPDPDDCLVPQSVGDVQATSASGGVALEFSGPGLSIPCALVFEAELTFAEPPSWLTPSVVFELGDVPVDGGCF
jgi:hypothetical protein